MRPIIVYVIFWHYQNRLAHMWILASEYKNAKLQVRRVKPCQKLADIEILDDSPISVWKKQNLQMAGAISLFWKQNFRTRREYVTWQKVTRRWKTGLQIEHTIAQIQWKTCFCTYFCRNIKESWQEKHAINWTILNGFEQHKYKMKISA